MDRLTTIVAGTAVASGVLVLLGWFSLPVRVIILGGAVIIGILAYRRWHRNRIPPLPTEWGGGGRRGEAIQRTLTHSLPLLALTAAALLILHASGTTNPIRSPWSVVPSALFAVFALLVAATVLLAFRGSRVALLGIACTLAVGSAVALFVYPIGFGFDHFIHAAAERIITDAGALSPRPYFYSAHYGLVTLLTTIGLPVATADRLLAPLLTLLLVPLLYRALTTHLSQRAALLGTTALALVPSLPLAVSTPQATANVFALATVLLMVKHEIRSTKSETIITEAQNAKFEFRISNLFRISDFGFRISCGVTLAVLASFLANPLTGIPLISAVVATLFARTRHRTLAVFSGIAGIIGIPIALMVASRMNTALDLRIGFSLTPLRTALASISDALTFRAADFSTADALALARFILPLLWTALAIVGVRRSFRPPAIGATDDAVPGYHPKRSDIFHVHVHTEFVTAVHDGSAQRAAASLWGVAITLVAALSVALTTTLSSQLSEEQSQLPLRLLSLAAVLSVPLVGRAVSQIANFKSQITSASGALVLATLATFTLLLAYPRDDAQARSGLWSVSSDDIAAVRAIADDAGDTRYVVLANQMLGAAAVREFGFRPSYRVCENDAPHFSPSRLEGSRVHKQQQLLAVAQDETGEAMSSPRDSRALKEGVARETVAPSTRPHCTEHLAFPLPAGGPLAQHFWSYLEQQNRCTQKLTAVKNCALSRGPIDAAMQLVSATRAYVVLHDYWRNYDRLSAATTAIADAEIGNLPHLRIFRFAAPTP